MTIRDPDILEQRLDDFDPAVRRDALAALTLVWMRGFAPVTANVNMHCHSFCSYNAAGYSPTRLAWEGRKAGLYAMALCDFDVLDGMAEFLDAAELLGLRAAVHLETRAFWREYGELEINSPGEPGVAYIMGAGFCRYPSDGTPQGRELSRLREAAQSRNVALIERINAHLPELRVSYQRETLPQTPNGVATERHIVRAYIAKAEKQFSDPQARAAFWEPLLKQSPSRTRALIDTPTAMEEAVRAALVKRGGLGYEAPSEAQFPPLDDFTAWVRDCGAIPTVTWLDGTSPGEKSARKLLEALQAKGCHALNIIPERNWNLKSADDKKIKVAALDRVIREAERLHLPINIGTEMNRAGLPFADNLQGPVLSHYRECFQRGARIMVGHTLLGRFADCPYTGKKAVAEWPRLRERNRRFEAVGALPPLTRERADELRDMGPAAAFRSLCDAVGD